MKDTPKLAEADFNNSAIIAQNILNDLSDRKPYVIVFLLDCCRTYHLRDSRVEARGSGGSDPRIKGLTAMHKAGSLIAFACAPGAIADEGKSQKHGLFTKYLLQHITKNKSIFNILCDVIKGVTEESNFQQVPFFNASLTEKIYLCEQRRSQLVRPGKYDIYL